MSDVISAFHYISKSNSNRVRFFQFGLLIDNIDFAVADWISGSKRKEDPINTLAIRVMNFTRDDLRTKSPPRRLCAIVP